MTIVWHDGSEVHSENFKDGHEMGKRLAELANAGIEDTLVMAGNIGNLFEKPGKGEKHESND